MAHKKAGGSSKNGRDSNSKRLGVKRFGGKLLNLVKLLFVNGEQTLILVKCWDGKRSHIICYF